MRRHAPDGQELPQESFVFGNECGEPVTSIRTAWEKTCARAGIRDLHFHDLRREFASRLLESSADLHDVQLFLGHAAVTTTSRYLQSTPVRLERALERLEESAGFAQDSHTAPMAGAAASPGKAGPDSRNALN